MRCFFSFPLIDLLCFECTYNTYVCMCCVCLLLQRLVLFKENFHVYNFCCCCCWWCWKIEKLYNRFIKLIHNRMIDDYFFLSFFLLRQCISNTNLLFLAMRSTNRRIKLMSASWYLELKKSTKSANSHTVAVSVCELKIRWNEKKNRKYRNAHAPEHTRTYCVSDAIIFSSLQQQCSALLAVYSS